MSEQQSTPTPTNQSPKPEVSDLAAWGDEGNQLDGPQVVPARTTPKATPSPPPIDDDEEQDGEDRGSQDAADEASLRMLQRGGISFAGRRGARGVALGHWRAHGNVARVHN